MFDKTYVDEIVADLNREIAFLRNGRSYQKGRAKFTLVPAKWEVTDLNTGMKIGFFNYEEEVEMEEFAYYRGLIELDQVM